MTTAKSEVVGEVVGVSLTDDDKPRVVDVEVDGREVIVRVGKDAARLDRHSVQPLIQALQAAFMEVN